MTMQIAYSPKSCSFGPVRLYFSTRGASGRLANFAHMVLWIFLVGDAIIPIFIRNLTEAEISQANAVDVDGLRDPQTLAERTTAGKENWLITLGVCTHLGCVPLGAAQGEIKGEFGGYFCPCHGSHYDTAARIRKGPAPTNLVVPEHEFLSDTVVKIG